MNSCLNTHYGKNYKMKISKCSKCEFESELNKEKLGLPLCNVCWVFAPNTPDELDKYIQEKINSESIKHYRKYASLIGDPQKKGMIKKASEGNPMSRPAFGYKFQEGKLVPAQNWREVEEIFEEFLNTKISLRQLSKKHNFSVNGLKKILRNFTYIGKIKFNNQIYQGDHQPLVSTTLFNHVQNKLDKILKKKINIYSIQEHLQKPDFFYS